MTTLAQVERMAEGLATCPVCGYSNPECSCVGSRRALITVASALLRRGLESAREKRLHAARQLLERSLATDGTNVAAWQALGLCAVTLGDTAVARKAWTSAIRLDNGSLARAWLESLERGEIAAALAGYNEAVDQATVGRSQEALRLIEKVLEKLPDFIPAWRMKGLLLAAVGKIPEAREAWCTAPCTDDTKLRAYLDDTDTPSRTDPPRARARGYLRPARIIPVGAAFALGFVVAVGVGELGRGSAVKPLAVAEVPPAQESASPRSRAEVPAAEHSQLPVGRSEAKSSVGTILGVVLDGDLDAIAELIITTGTDQSKWSTEARVAGQRTLMLAGWHNFRGAMRALRQDDTARAVQKLTLSVRYGVDGFYHDDALYALARAHEQIGNKPEARECARDLLERYPQSQFANSVARRLAALGEGTS